jgi:hypothetical protein
VLELVLKDVKGWTQDVVNVKQLDEVPDLDRKNIVALTVEVMRPEQLDLSGQWASLIFVLQSHDNYWMPLQDVKLGELPPGEWQHVELELDRDQRQSMRAFFQIITVINSGPTLNGSLYLDDLGFVVQAEKQ